MATDKENIPTEQNNIILTTFYNEEDHASRPRNLNRFGEYCASTTDDSDGGSRTRSKTSKWSHLRGKDDPVPEDSFYPTFTVPKSIVVHPIVYQLRNTPIDVTCIKDLPSEVPRKSDENTDNDSEATSELIKVVKKDNMFGTEVTETEMAIIQQRVARQQQQFAEYQHREKVRKIKKVYSIFEYLTVEEMDEMLKDCKDDEDEAIVRMTEPTYLLEIRKTIASRHTPTSKSSGAQSRNNTSKMTGSQLQAYQKLLNKRSTTLRKTTDDITKKQYRLGGRLALDDAIRQVQEQGMDATNAFEGWSAARIRAYNLIDQNPNSYYYRFNAPGEIQRKGQWAADERKLFFDRLEEVGANGQWGYFAMTIPGRVGYQCSNFYRLLVENGEVDDPNYVLDEKGKAHYLFDKKTANGKVEKTFRTHNKQPRNSTPPASTDADSPGSTTTTTRRKRTTTSASTTASTSKSTVKRKRRARRWGSDDDDDDDDDDDEEDTTSMFEDWQDTSGSYTASTRGTRASTRRTRARMNDVDVDEEQNPDTITSNGIDNGNDESGNDEGSNNDNNDSNGNNNGVAESQEQDQLTEEYHDDDDAEGVPEPLLLPGFIDPITLDQVEKPAISKYGHVMGYASWMRCLTNWEGKRNICPLTKKPLSKRDLVILTIENIDEYKQVENSEHVIESTNNKDQEELV